MTEAVSRARAAAINRDAPRWVASVTAQQWRKAYVATSDLLTEYLRAVRQREDGTEIAAYVVQHALDLVGHGIVQFADPAVAVIRVRKCGAARMKRW